jgi:hypothetical protein
VALTEAAPEVVDDDPVLVADPHPAEATLTATASAAT